MRDKNREDRKIQQKKNDTVCWNTRTGLLGKVKQIDTTKVSWNASAGLLGKVKQSDIDKLKKKYGLN